MRRALVLTNEAAKHAFRQSLPQHVFLTSGKEPVPARQARSDDHDWKLFVLSFAAFFTAFYSFIA